MCTYTTLALPSLTLGDCEMHASVLTSLWPCRACGPAPGMALLFGADDHCHTQRVGPQQGGHGASCAWWVRRVLELELLEREFKNRKFGVAGKPGKPGAIS